ncbi:MAG TPA: YciI family protein [Candidatus Binatia bacterium]|nr:YciI family protein [Candidatus Binatia bacterium]
MQYLCLIYQDESIVQNRSKAELDALYAEYRDFTERIKKSGRLVGLNRLQPIRTAATVRVRDGNVVATDGPFAETKEQLGGYYLIEARDLNEAIQTAAGCPSARFGSVEVRPIWEMQPAVDSALHQTTTR